MTDVLIAGGMFLALQLPLALRNGAPLAQDGSDADEVVIDP